MLVLLGLGIIVLGYIYYEEYCRRRENRPEGRVVGIWNSKERRRFKRFPVNLSLRYEIIENPSYAKSVNTRDISKGGIGLIMYEKLKEGTPLRIWVDIPNRKEKLFILGNIVWQKEVTKDNLDKRIFYTGVCFTTLDTPTQMHLFNFISSLEKDGYCGKTDGK